MPDHAAIYRRRVERAKAAGYPSFYAMRIAQTPAKRPPDGSILLLPDGTHWERIDGEWEGPYGESDLPTTN